MNFNRQFTLDRFSQQKKKCRVRWDRGALPAKAVGREIRGDEHCYAN